MITAIIWIVISAPIWISLTVIYLAIKYVYLIIVGIIKILFSLIGSVIKGFSQGSEYETNSLLGEFLMSVLRNVFSAVLDFFSSIDDIYTAFWNFAFDHQIITIILILFLIFIYYFILNLIYNSERYY